MDSAEISKKVQIKDLPIKTEVDPNSVILIQDNDDTKKMPVSVFVDYIQKLGDLLRQDTMRYLEILQTEITRCQGIINGLVELDNVIQNNEKTRIANESARSLVDIERTEKFNVWADRWKIWEQFYDNTVIAENERVSNEEYRTKVWAEWTELLATWANQETIRQTNEANRTKTFNTTIKTANETIEEMRALITQTNNLNTENTAAISEKIAEVNTLINNTTALNTSNTEYIEQKATAIDNSINTCTAATNRCVEVTNTLDEMIDIGTAVPTSLPTARIYLQYFT